MTGNNLPAYTILKRLSVALLVIGIACSNATTPESNDLAVSTVKSSIVTPPVPSTSTFDGADPSETPSLNMSPPSAFDAIGHDDTDPEENLFATDYGVIPLDETLACDDYRDLGVYFVGMEDGDFKAMFGERTFVATQYPDPDSGQEVPVIAYNQDLVSHTPEEFQRFAFQHECFHHINGDQSPGAPDRGVRTISKEDAADRYAVERLVADEGYGEAKFETIKAYLAAIVKLGGADSEEIARRMAAIDSMVTDNLWK